MSGNVIDSPRRKTFAELLATGTMSKTEAAVQAGFGNTRASAKSYAAVISKHDDIVSHVETIRAKAESDAVVTYESHITKLAELRDAAARDGKHGAAVTAETQRGKAAGIYDRGKSETEQLLDKASLTAKLVKLAKSMPEIANLITPAMRNVTPK